MKQRVLGGCLVVMSALASAQDIKGISFSHQDWEIYCSNTGTCRAAGYQNDESAQPASLLLTRQAGAKQPVYAEFALSTDQDSIDNIPIVVADDTDVLVYKLGDIHLYINGKDWGKVKTDHFELPLMGKLSTTQVNALLQQSKQHTDIVFKNEFLQWHISDAGMTAVLLKMDDFQKRIGTTGALVKKGQTNESKVLAAQPKLVVQRVKTTSRPYLSLQPNHKQYKALYTRLMAIRPASKEQEFCEGLYSGDGKISQPIELYKLNNQKVLAMTLCWRGAYNEGYGAWVLDASLTGQVNFVTESASDFDAGVISSAQKGRGIGDCWSSAEWVWDGQNFVQTRDMWTGMCKGLTAGGVWELERIESIVKN